jgi:hypothetical protein
MDNEKGTVRVVALVRGEVCAGTLARRTPPNWDGALDSALGKSFTTRQILSPLSLSASFDFIAVP